jgi:hypothetical protein
LHYVYLLSIIKEKAVWGNKYVGFIYRHWNTN